MALVVNVAFRDELGTANKEGSPDRRRRRESDGRDSHWQGAQQSRAASGGSRTSGSAPTPMEEDDSEWASRGRGRAARYEESGAGETTATNSSGAHGVVRDYGYNPRQPTHGDRGRDRYSRYNGPMSSDRRQRGNK